MKAKQKSPAFLFYPNDYLGGTMHFSVEQHGAYLLLLIHQFNRGKFVEADAKRILGQAFPNVWEVVREKFTSDGMFHWNARLEDEMEKRSKFCKSRQDNLLGVGMGDSSPHMEPHMENRNENGNVNRFFKPVLPEVIEYFKEIGLRELSTSEGEKFFNYYESKGWKVGKTPMKNWKAACRNWKSNLKEYATKNGVSKFEQQRSQLESLRDNALDSLLRG